MKGTIINITRFCTDDGPGIRTTVFLKGCPLKCIWCHNPESQNADIESYTTGEAIGRTVTSDEILEEVLKDKVFYETSGGGITLSGGEPLFQPDFTAEILKACKKNDIHTAIETSGFAKEEVLNKCLKHCDLVLFDLKETNRENHIKFTGVEFDVIMDNLKAVNKSGIPFIIRLPVIPTLNDRKEHFKAVKSLSESLKMCCGVQIMPYHKLGVYKYSQLGREYKCSHINEPTKEQIRDWENYFCRQQKN